jgi:methoxymalonate biosynthesis acyl carrier protein
MTIAEITAPVTTGAVQEALLSFLTERVKAEVAPDQDLFASGLVSSSAAA